MPNAYLAIHTASGMSPSVMDALENIDAVVEAHVVAGKFDIMAELEASVTTDLLPIVTREIRKIEGVGTTRTYVVLD